MPPPIPPLPPRLRTPTSQQPTSGTIVAASGPLTAPPLIPPPAAPRAAAPSIAPPRATDYDEALETIPDASLAVGDDSKLVVPIGEFDERGTALEPDKLRIAHAQATIKRDAASALLGIAEAPLTVVKETPVEVLLTESAAHLRGDPTAIDSATEKFERGDPTAIGRGDATAEAVPAPSVHTRAGRLRTVAALRRQRGILGDVRYVRTALFGVRRSRHELVELESTQATRQHERRRHLVILGRTAVTSDAFDHPALGPARDQLVGIEDERGRHRAQVLAADQELQRVTKDREGAAKQHVTDLAAIDAELAELAKRLEPLHKEQVSINRRAAELREALRRLDARLAETTASLVSVKKQEDPASIHAELARLKADRAAVHKDEPQLASELDALNPRIAAIEAKRADGTQRRAELVQREQDDQRRAEELLAAIGAKRKVMDRAAGDAETVRDRILFELGERLYHDHPGELAAQLSPIDTIDLELGTTDRRVMELKEILSSIDKLKLARGIAVIVLALAALAGLVSWLIYTLA